ncbi:NlpC/P60 family protein [Actinokineospora sp. HUAS TT18]|uniref:C40 family peptidase n=1 Tax=Actinokineospora sp. HUAS TT18 TaxID=3447451 RepID=UPI003F51ED92
MIGWARALVVAPVLLATGALLGAAIDSPELAGDAFVPPRSAVPRIEPSDTDMHGPRRWRLEQELSALENSTDPQAPEAAKDAEPSTDQPIRSEPSFAANGFVSSAANHGRAALMEYAFSQRGKPYQWGGTGPDSFDCSGLTQQTYLQIGISLPRTARQQARVGASVELRDLQPGDLVFWALRDEGAEIVNHVGLYVGGTMVIHAPQTGDVVKISRLWLDGYAGAKRILPRSVGAAAVEVPPLGPPSTSPSEVKESPTAPIQTSEPTRPRATTDEATRLSDRPSEPPITALPASGTPLPTPSGAAGSSPTAESASEPTITSVGPTRTPTTSSGSSTSTTSTSSETETSEPAK